MIALDLINIELRFNTAEDVEITNFYNWRLTFINEKSNKPR